MTRPVDKRCTRYRRKSCWKWRIAYFPITIHIRNFRFTRIQLDIWDMRILPLRSNTALPPWVFRAPKRISRSPFKENGSSGGAIWKIAAERNDERQTSEVFLWPSPRQDLAKVGDGCRKKFTVTRWHRKTSLWISFHSLENQHVHNGYYCWLYVFTYQPQWHSLNGLDFSLPSM